jgi:glycine/D-amino acid oxidase-like deaminating enzyme
VDVAIVGGGFAGLSTAYFLRQAAPSLRVAVLEAGVVGYGASGRNAGFAMTIFGLSLPVMVARFGRRRAMEAYRFMAGAVDHLQALVAEHGIACDLEANGFLRVATSRTHLARLRHEHSLAQQMGIEDLEFLDASAVRQQVDSPLYLGVLAERRCALVNPARLTRGLKRIAHSAGAEIYEGTPVRALHRGGRLRLDTPAGAVEAEKVVLATNAFSARFGFLRSKQVPIFTHIVLTEPLDQAQLAPIGWRRRQGVEDAPNLFHTTASPPTTGSSWVGAMPTTTTTADSGGNGSLPPSPHLRITSAGSSRVCGGCGSPGDGGDRSRARWTWPRRSAPLDRAGESSTRWAA